MCGICGHITRDPRASVDESTLRRMTDSLVHRGPDGEGFHRAPGVGLGVRRLAIVDLKTGDQPIANEDGSIVVVCNGEIYNHVELRAELERAGHRFGTRSDVETIVHLYEDLGLESLHRLRGMFAFAIWDATRRRLVLARDRFGIKPLVWSPTRDGIAFASEFKALLAGDLVDPALDPAAIDDLFSWGWVVTPRSACAGVRRLPAGHLLVYEGGREEVRRWWTPPLLRGDEPPALSEGEWAEGLLARLEEAVRLHLRSDVPVGAWLSGGIDSSGVAALAARILGRTIDTFSLEFEDPDYDEVGSTRTLDRFPGYDLRGFRTRYSDETRVPLPRGLWHGEDLGSSGGVRQAIAKLTASRVKVALAGEGADEMLGGYWWYKWDRGMRLFSRLQRVREKWRESEPVGRERRIVRLARVEEGPGPEPFQILVGQQGAEIRREFYSDALIAALDTSPAAPLPTPPEIAKRDPVEWLQYWDITIRMQNFILDTLDHHSMAWSIEMRVPFLDHEVAEWCLAMPPSLKRGRPEKKVLRRALAEDLPREILERPKRPLRGSPGDLPPFAAELLSPEKLREKGWFDPESVTHALAQNRGLDQGELRSVLRVQLWDELFVQGRGPDDFELGVTGATSD
jgi:asparagine synthase (glutamine-hydrolysing)